MNQWMNNNYQWSNEQMKQLIYEQMIKWTNDQKNKMNSKDKNNEPMCKWMYNNNKNQWTNECITINDTKWTNAWITIKDTNAKMNQRTNVQMN